MRSLLDRLRRLSRSLSRKVKGSRNRDKAKRRLSRTIVDMGFHELRRQLSYKAAWRGGHVVVVDRWYPSSKTCSCCGYRLQDLALGTRSWTCPECGAHHDRDVNAAVNLNNMAMSSIASAGGGNGSGPVCEHETSDLIKL
jgi:putative transposase